MTTTAFSKLSKEFNNLGQILDGFSVKNQYAESKVVYPVDYKKETLDDGHTRLAIVSQDTYTVSQDTYTVRSSDPYNYQREELIKDIQALKKTLQELGLKFNGC